MNTFVENQAIRIILNQLEISKFDGFDSPWQQQSVENRFSDISFHNRSSVYIRSRLSFNLHLCTSDFRGHEISPIP